MNLFKDEAHRIELCKMFGGKDGAQQNALMTALWVAAGGKDNEHVYEFMESPKTSFIVFLSDALDALGYKIVKK